jgi:hypothetical protein
MMLPLDDLFQDSQAACSKSAFGLAVFLKPQQAGEKGVI